MTYTVKLTLKNDWSIGAIVTDLIPLYGQIQAGESLLNFSAKVDAWKQAFNHAPYTLLENSITTNSITNNVAYAYAVLPDDPVFGPPDPTTFVRLAQLWSNNGILVSDLVNVAGIAPTAQDQADLNSQNPGLTDGAVDFLKGTVAMFTKILNGVATAAEIVVGIVLVGLLLWYHPWDLLPMRKAA